MGILVLIEILAVTKGQRIWNATAQKKQGKMKAGTVGTGKTSNHIGFIPEGDGEGTSVQAGFLIQCFVKLANLSLQFGNLFG